MHNKTRDVVRDPANELFKSREEAIFSSPTLAEDSCRQHSIIYNFPIQYAETWVYNLFSHYFRQCSKKILSSS